MLSTRSACSKGAAAHQGKLICCRCSVTEPMKGGQEGCTASDLYATNAHFFPPHQLHFWCVFGTHESSHLKPTTVLYGKELGIPCILSVLSSLSAPDVCKSKTECAVFES